MRFSLEWQTTKVATEKKLKERPQKWLQINYFFFPPLGIRFSLWRQSTKVATKKAKRSKSPHLVERYVNDRPRKWLAKKKKKKKNQERLKGPPPPISQKV
jgi:hypothetical protein